MLTPISSIAVASGITFLLIAAYHDLTKFTIPNELCALVAGLGLLRLVVSGDLDTSLYTIAAAIFVFLIMLLLFARGYIGGGDAKLVTATVILVGVHNLFPFIAGMSIAGAFLALIVFVRFRILTNQPARMIVPYGVAIASAAIITLVSQSSIIPWCVTCALVHY